MNPAETVIIRCWWCGTVRGPFTAVGFIEGATGAGRHLQACQPCVNALRLVPLDQHPDDTDGRPRYRPRLGAPS